MNPTYPILIVGAMLVAISGLQAQSPGGVSTNLSLWVRADDALPATGGTITSWPGKSGPNNFSISTTRGATLAKTVTNSINFHPTVQFAGSVQSTLTGSTSITWSECSAVAAWTGATTTERGTVISPTTSGTDATDASRYFFRSGVEATPGDYTFAGMGVNAIGFEYITSPPSGQYNVLTASGTNAVFNENGLNAVAGSLFGGYQVTTETAIPQIGMRSTGDAPMIGNIAEIIVYSADNSANRNKVESYLALKYGISLGTIQSPINYTSSAGNTFWTGSTTWQHNIFGVGADAGSGLTQTKSNSMNSGTGNGAGQSGLGNLVLTSNNTLNNQQFLMLGTDSTALTEETMTTTNGPIIAAGSKRLVRTWRVQNTGSVGSVNLTYDLTGLPTYSGGATAANYYLMIDNDGDGNFTTGTQTYIQASSINTLLSFNAITLQNNIVFTIITKASSFLPLPVSWQSFTTTANQDQATLQWTVGSDIDIDHFEVQRSINGIDFTTQTQIAAGSTPVYQYQQQLSPGKYYYRIQLLTKDREDLYSPIRTIQIAGPAFVKIRTNPIIGNQLQLDVNVPQIGSSQIEILDRQGKILVRQSTGLQTGDNEIKIPLPPSMTGVFFVRIQTAQLTRTLTFLK